MKAKAVQRDDQARFQSVMNACCGASFPVNSNEKFTLSPNRWFFLMFRSLVLGSFLACFLTASAQELVEPIAYNKPGSFGSEYPDVWLKDGSGDRLIGATQEISSYLDPTCMAGCLFGADLPVWSKDGRRIAVNGVIAGGPKITAFSTPSNTLVVFDPAGAPVFVPINAPRTIWKTFKAFSPDGKKIAFANLSALNFVEFGIVSLDGPSGTLTSGITLLFNSPMVSVGARNNTEGLSGMGIDWSPTNENLLVVSASDPNASCNLNGRTIPAFGTVTKLFFVKPEEGGLDRGVPLTIPFEPPCLTPFLDLYQISDLFPAFSPDGTEVAFVRLIKAGTSATSSIRVIKIADDNNIPLPADQWKETAVTPEFSQVLLGPVSWSPDGKRLAFGSTLLFSGIPLPNGGAGIWTINRDGSGLSQLHVPGNSNSVSNPSWRPGARPPIHVKGNATSSPVGMSPQQTRHAYGFDLVANQGAGQTIGIVVAFDHPNIESDLAIFDTTFGLAACTTNNGCFRKIYAAGVKPVTNPRWALETSLDVEWVHAIAPQGKILLVEAPSSSFTDLLNAVDVAVQSGVNVVSMSWGGGEFSTQTSFDIRFAHNGITFLASSGDSGVGVEYPAASPDVVAVGGTTLNADSIGNYLGEVAWNGSAGGQSAFEREPLYQANHPIPNNSGQWRGLPDVAYNGDPNFGFAVYDTVGLQGQEGWFQVGGTSAGTPQWAALFAVANSLRIGAGKTLLSGTNSALYGIAQASYATNYHDITQGSNGDCGALCTAGIGYDYVSGLGSPKANNIIAALVNLP